MLKNCLLIGLDKSDPNNYRGISLKLRSEPQLDPQLREYQGNLEKVGPI